MCGRNGLRLCRENYVVIASEYSATGRITMVTNCEKILQDLLQLDDWSFMRTIQKALLEKNARNREEFVPHPRSKELSFFLGRAEPAQYVVALWQTEPSEASEGNATFTPRLDVLAMHSADQVNECLEAAADPSAWLERRITAACSYHEGGGCNKCKIKLSAAAKMAYCPICGGDVYLT